MPDEELSKFKREIDLRAFAASHDYQLDRKESWAGSAVMRHMNGDKIVVKRNAADGHYEYFSVRDSDDNGTIIDFAMRRLGVSLGAARKELRAFMGLPQPIPAPYPPLFGVAKDRLRVERACARMTEAPRHPYLERERYIPRAVLESRRFAGRIRIDGRGNAIFPHYDADGLCGFEIKNRGFTGFSTGGSKGLWTSNAETTDNRMAFCESAIDALSLAALDGLDPNTRYASIGGKPTRVQLTLIRAAAAVMPKASTVLAAMDADAAGRELCEMIREAVKLTGRHDIRFDIIAPSLKDFNDQLRACRGTVNTGPLREHRDPA